MPLEIDVGHPTLFIKKEAFERAGLTRSGFDQRLGLTDAEFRVEGHLIAIGPIYEEDAVRSLIDELEGLGLFYFEDFFELSGNWPEWLRLVVVPPRG